MSEMVPFTEISVLGYLNTNIRFWRQRRDDAPDTPGGTKVRVMAEHYVDAFQLVRMSLFGETLPAEGEEGVQNDPVAHIPPLTPEAREEVSLLVQTEIDRQDSLARAGKFDGTHILPSGPDPERMVVLTEEVFEALLITSLERVNQLLNSGILAEGYERQEGLYDELIQTAACAEAWAAAILEDR